MRGNITRRVRDTCNGIEGLELENTTRSSSVHERLLSRIPLRNRSPLFHPSERARAIRLKKDAKEIKLIPFTGENNNSLSNNADRCKHRGIWKRVNRRFHVSRNWNFIGSNAIRWDSCSLYCLIYLLWNLFFQASLLSRETERSPLIKILTIEV